MALSKTGRFLSKAEILGVGVFSPLPIFVAQNGLFGAPFRTPKIPEKVYVYVPLLRSFPGNEAHKLFSGGPKQGFWVAAKKFMLKKFMCFFCPLEEGVKQF